MTQYKSTGNPPSLVLAVEKCSGIEKFILEPCFPFSACSLTGRTEGPTTIKKLSFHYAFIFIFQFTVLLLHQLIELRVKMQV